MEENIVLQKLEEITKEVSKISHIGEQVENILTKLEEHDKRFEAIDVKLADHDEKFDLIIQKIIEHDERLDQMVTKTEFNAFVERQTAVNDQLLTMIKRLDEDRYAMIEWMRRIEEKMDRKFEDYDKTFQKIKQELKLSF